MLDRGLVVQTELCFLISMLCGVNIWVLTFMFVKPLTTFLSLLQDIKSMTMLCPDHLEDAGRLGKD